MHKLLKTLSIVALSLARWRGCFIRCDNGKSAGYSARRADG